jgi:spermidine synthase
LLHNPKVEIIIDDGRRWLARHPDRTFDAIIQNTTWHFRPNVTNLLSQEYLRLAQSHLRDGGIMMVNTTWSLRAMLTGCTVFPHALRELNLVVGSNAPLRRDPAHLRTMLEGLAIDGNPAFDLADAAHRHRIDAIVDELASVRDGPDQATESCDSIRSRAAGRTIITDDNMGEEW